MLLHSTPPVFPSTSALDGTPLKWRAMLAMSNHIYGDYMQTHVSVSTPKANDLGCQQRDTMSAVVPIKLPGMCAYPRRICSNPAVASVWNRRRADEAGSPAPCFGLGLAEKVVTLMSVGHCVCSRILPLLLRWLHPPHLGEKKGIALDEHALQTSRLGPRD